LVVPCPVKILYSVLFTVAKESRYMCKISLWPFGSDCLYSTFQCSVSSSRLRFFVHASSSSCVSASLSLLKATLTGLGRFLASMTFSLAPVPNLWLSMAFTRHCPDCRLAHI
jgi:hypothetical protein